MQLSRKLNLSTNYWHIAASFHPLFCNQSLEQIQVNETNFCIKCY
ncbi:hypothetical protein Hdeb2414_s0002g00066231 [Helianthus debilis subsp. tardiflorus]